MDISIIPALSDNYTFVISNGATGEAVIVDAAEARGVIDFLKERDLKLVAILNTHHHGDHVGANRELANLNPGLRVCAGENDRGRIPFQTEFLKDGDQIVVLGKTAQVFFVPGHTRGHIAYYFAPGEIDANPNLFCGDTIFGAGCGKLFEGTFAQMFDSLSRLRALPQNCKIWCAHEYTEENLDIAVKLDPEHEPTLARLKRVQNMRKNNVKTVPLLLSEECESNPFFRYDDAHLQKVTGTEGQPLEAFTAARKFRDQF